jgi:hypothetical protein
LSEATIQRLPTKSMWKYFHLLRAVVRFHDYNPQHVSMDSVARWMKQFKSKGDLMLACSLLKRVIYFSAAETKKILLQQNNALMEDMQKAGLPARKLIYLSTDDAGSSSPEMLGMLRNFAGLEQRGCKLLDGRDAMGINAETRKREQGAIIYIDDFVGSGKQFERARNFAQQSVVGTFSEFLLVPSICEEGYARLTKMGVTVYSGHIHSKAERPLHDHSHLMTEVNRERLTAICKEIRPNTALGYENMATMVVIYRNAPNSIPAVLRGSDKQQPFYGLFPRFKDLPIKKL